MATITYELGKPKQDKTRKVSIVLSHKGQRKRFPTNIVVSDSDLSRAGKISSRKILKTIEDKMNVMKDALYDLEVDLLGKDVDIDWICEHLIDIGNKTEDLDFFSFTEEWVEKSDNKGKKNYLIMLNSLARYNGCRKLPFSLIDYRFLNGYKKFLDGHPRAQSYTWAICGISSMKLSKNIIRMEMILSEVILLINSPFRGIFRRQKIG